MSEENSKSTPQETSIHLDGMYENWFLDYASYVILERAVPTLNDGLKPVQRRILHAMKEMDDGRFHKVANIIGQTMQYHPHGDAAIGDALVNLGQKDLLIDTQGNWGDYRTGDPSAAPRYIEARLSKFALEAGFNEKITQWQASYDGRKREPVALPMKFPLVLAQGVEGIAVGLATKILPHNFIELCKGSIDVLKGKKTRLYPDFNTGGSMDVSQYQGGKRGGKVRVRSTIEILDKKLLAIRDVPYGTTTSSLIDSILKANDKGKIKIKRVTDNTAAEVDILIELPGGISPEKTMDALYAFTECEASISPNTCVIIDNKPHFLDVNELLRLSTENTQELLRLELEIRKAELEEKWHFASLEKIFIEKRIYRDIEEEETWEGVVGAIDKGLHKYISTPARKNGAKGTFQLNRDVTEEDIVRLTEIRIKRISKYDSFKAEENIQKLEDELAEVKHHLAHLTEYAIAWFEKLLEKYGDGRERKTEIKTFDTIVAKRVVVANKKLYAKLKEGFIGYGLKDGDYIADCSDLDDVIVFFKNGTMKVVRVEEKVFVGKDILYSNIWKKGNERMIYHLIYADAKKNVNYVKRFAVTSITRDKEYVLTKNPGAKVIYFSANPNSEEEVVQVQLNPGSRARQKVFDFDFGALAIKGRGAAGNMLTKYSIRKVTQKEVGAATLGGRRVWLDETVGRINYEDRGRLLGSFDTEDSILVIYKTGEYEMTNIELSNRYDMNKVMWIGKFDPEQVVSAVYYDSDKRAYYVKRFLVETTTLGQRFSFINESPSSELTVVSLEDEPAITYTATSSGKKRTRSEETLALSAFIDVKGWRAQGNKLGTRREVSRLKLVETPHEKADTQDSKTDNSEAEDAGNSKSPEANSKQTSKPEKTKAKSGELKDQPKSANQEINTGDSLEWDLDGKDKDPKVNKGEQGDLFGA